MAKTFKKIDKLPQGFVDSVGSMSEDEIKNRMVELECGISELEKKMEEDADLESLKLALKEAKETYTVPKKELSLQIRYLVYELETRGKI